MLSFYFFNVIFLVIKPFFKSAHSAFFVANFTKTSSSRCYTSLFMPQQYRSCKVSCVNSSTLLFQNVSMVLLLEHSCNSVQHIHAFKSFTGHIWIWNNFITYVFFQFQKSTTYVFHLIFFNKQIYCFIVSLFKGDDSYIKNINITHHHLLLL